MNIDITAALLVLRPNSSFSVIGNDYSGIKWYSDDEVPTEDEVNNKIAELQAAEPMKLLRETRNRLLAETDWTQNRDVVLLNDIDWKQYRQDLRDLPTSSSFTPKLDSHGKLDMSSVIWPLKPS